MADLSTDGARLKVWRQIQGHSLRGFARMLEWEPAKLYRIEEGKQPLKDTDRRHALSVLGLTDLEFFGQIGRDAIAG